ncbi:MAG: aldose 1-epimerase family protein [Planctomycetota bacterium]
MPFLYDKQFSREEILKKVGDISQIGGVKPYELTEGNQKGVKAVDFRTGTGFGFTVLPGRGMDISSADYNGIPLCWHSATGAVAPEYFESEGAGWLRSFYGGLVHTCGLTYLGAPCNDKGQELGLHGRISNIPAKSVYADAGWQGDEYLMWVQGKVRETAVFGENLLLSRKVLAGLGETHFHLHDIVENLGYQKTEFMILYHINLGFPVLDENSQLILPTKSIKPRDAEAKKGLKQYNKFTSPQPDFKEQVFYHEAIPDKKGNVTIALVNKKINNNQGLGIYITYSTKELPNLIQWKMLREGMYVLGIEPANCLVEGRAKERKRGTLQFLKPGEKREFHLEIGVLTSYGEIKHLESSKSKK